MDSIKPPSTGESSPVTLAKEPEIKTMPEKYIGASLNVPPKPTERVVVVEKIVERKVASPPIVIKAPPKKARVPKWAIVAGIILVLSSVAALYYALTLSKPAPIVPVTSLPPPPVVEIPIPQPPPPVPQESGPKMGRDTDSDSLTDSEENLYGSNPNNPDSDNDGFLDGVEVFHLYNPAGEAPVRLLDTGSVKIYSNPQYKYQIYSPSPWTIMPSGNGSVVKFAGSTREAIEINIEENSAHLPLVNWYLSRNSGVKPSELRTFITKSNLDGVKSPDRLTAYISANGFIYVISYRLGTDETMNFLSTFEMMLNSFLRTK